MTAAYQKKDVFDDEAKRRLDNIKQTNKLLFQAYYLKEYLEQIWRQENRQWKDS